MYIVILVMVCMRKLGQVPLGWVIGLPMVRSSRCHHERDWVVSRWYQSLRFTGLNCTELPLSRVLWIAGETFVAYLLGGYRMFRNCPVLLILVVYLVNGPSFIRIWLCSFLHMDAA